MYNSLSRTTSSQVLCFYEPFEIRMTLDSKKLDKSSEMLGFKHVTQIVFMWESGLVRCRTLGGSTVFNFLI